MTRPRAVTFVPPNRLSSILTGADRTSFADHINRANAEVRRVTPRLTVDLNEAIAVLSDLCHRDEDLVFQLCREIGHLTLRIVETARLAGRADLAGAAEGIWDLVNALTSRGVWHTQALRVHADALSALSGLSDEAPGGRDVILELARLRAAIGAGPQP